MNIKSHLFLSQISLTIWVYICKLTLARKDKKKKFITNVPHDQFVLDHPAHHYMKISSWAKYKSEFEHFIPHYVGLENNNELIATALLLQKKTMIFNYFYIPWGMCCDYENEDTTRLFLQFIKENVHQLKCNFLKIDLNIERLHRNIHGEEIKDGFNHEFVKGYFIKEGFNYKGYGYAYNGSWVNPCNIVK